MKKFFHKSLRLLYLVYCLPTQFRREVEERFPISLIGIEKFKATRDFLFQPLPLIVVVSCLINFLVGITNEVYGRNYNWMDSWLGVGFGIAFGVAGGIAGGVAFNVAFGVTGGVVGSLVGGVAFGVANGMKFGVAKGVAFGAAFAVAGGVNFGMAGGIAFAVAFAIAFAVSLGLAEGMAFLITFLFFLFRILDYIIEVLLSSLLYFLSTLYKDQVKQLWNWCPIVWSEVIWFRLPFAGKLLINLIKQDRGFGFQQLTFIAAERNLQSRVIDTALVEILIEDLAASSLPNLAVTNQKLEWTVRLPVNLEPVVKLFLPDFVRISQKADQYLNLNSQSRKSESLSKIINEIKSLQSSLISTRGEFSYKLLGKANKWQEIVEAEYKTVSLAMEESIEIHNPFNFGNPILEVLEEGSSIFTGRRDIIEQIENSLLGVKYSPTLLLHGPRRMGKTSILKQLPRLLGPEFAPTIVDCQNQAVVESKISLLSLLSKALSEGLKRRYITIESLTVSSLAENPYTVFSEWLEKLENNMPDKMKVLICVDEYEQFVKAIDAGWGEDFLDILRHWIQHHPRLVFMFTGSHTFEDMGPKWMGRFISTRRLKVSFLSYSEVRTLLTSPVPKFNLTYSNGVIENIFTMTHGQPFLTQAVAFELVLIVNSKKKTVADCDDTNEAVKKALNRGGEYFANIWNEAGEQCQAIMCAIAFNSKPIHFSDVNKWLFDHDVIDEKGKFAVPMVEMWIKENKRGQ